MLQDPFDYAAEDAMVAAWRRGDLEGVRSVTWAKEVPGFTSSYYGMAENPWDGQTQDTRHEGEYDVKLGRRVKPEEK